MVGENLSLRTGVTGGNLCTPGLFCCLFFEALGKRSPACFQGNKNSSSFQPLPASVAYSGDRLSLYRGT